MNVWFPIEMPEKRDGFGVDRSAGVVENSLPKVFLL